MKDKDRSTEREPVFYMTSVFFRTRDDGSQKKTERRPAQIDRIKNVTNKKICRFFIRKVRHFPSTSGLYMEEIDIHGKVKKLW